MSNMKEGKCVMGEMRKDRENNSTGRVKELENSLSIALEVNDKFQRENVALLKSRPLDTMDEIAYRELEAENKKLKKRVQEADGETSIVKGIGINSPEMKKAQARSEHLQSELDRVKKENNNLFIRVADSLEVNEHHQNLNGKLRVRVSELEEENEKLSKQISDHIENKMETFRKSGL